MADPSPSRSRGGLGRGGWGPPLLVAVLAVLAHLPTLGAGFVGDDVQIPSAPHLRQGDGWRSVLGESWTYPFLPHRNEYRPLTSFTYWAQSVGTAEGEALAPRPFHAVDLALHAGCALVLRLVLVPLFGRRPALFGALVFAVHPLLSEAVATVVGRAELLAVLLGLGAWCVHLRGHGRPSRRRRLAVFALLVGSVLAKESGLAFAAVVVVTDWMGLSPAARRRRREPLRLLASQAPVLLAPFGALVVRLAFRGPEWSDDVPFFVDNPLVLAAPPARWATALWMVVRGWGLFLWPDRLSVDYSFDQVPLVRTAADPRLAVTVLVLLAVFGTFAFAWRRGLRAPLWSLVAYLTLLLPTSNLILVIGTIFGERLLYAPGLAFSALVGWTMDRLLRLGRPSPRVVGALGVAVLAALASRTLVRSTLWADEPALYARQEVVAPRSVRTWKSSAILHLDAGRPAEALAALERGFDIANWSDLWMLRAEALAAQGRFDAAASSVERALALGETSPNARRLLDLYRSMENRPPAARPDRNV